MKFLHFILIFILIHAILGCSTRTVVATNSADETNAEGQWQSLTSAAIGEASQGVNAMPASSDRDVASLHLENASAMIPVKATAKDKKDAEQVSQLVRGGNVSEALIRSKAIREAAAAAQEIVRQEREKSAKAIVAMQEAHAKEIHDLKNSFEAKARWYITLVLYGLIAACIILAAFRVKAAISSGAVLNLTNTLKEVGVYAGAASTFWTVNKMLNSDWLYYALYAIAAALIGYFAYLTFKERKEKSKAEALKQIVPVVDKYYDNSDEKNALDSTLFKDLSDNMTDEAKLAIHTVRAEPAKA